MQTLGISRTTASPSGDHCSRSTGNSPEPGRDVWGGGEDCVLGSAFFRRLLLYTAVLSDRVGCRGVRRPRMVTLGTVRSLERLDCRSSSPKSKVARHLKCRATARH